jgi:hypothetical protein
MVRVFAPVDHRYVAPEVEVRVTLPPAQKVIGPEAVIAGVVIEQVERKKGYSGSFIKSVIFP